MPTEKKKQIIDSKFRGFVFNEFISLGTLGKGIFYFTNYLGELLAMFSFSISVFPQMSSTLNKYFIKSILITSVFEDPEVRGHLLSSIPPHFSSLKLTSSQ